MLAVFLDVPIPPRAVRRLLADEALIATMDRLLKKVPTDADLWEVERGVLEAADQAWAELVKLRDVGPVRAGKLLARKRPRVVPIWDDVVASGRRRDARGLVVRLEARCRVPRVAGTGSDHRADDCGSPARSR